MSEKSSHIISPDTYFGLTEWQALKAGFDSLDEFSKRVPESRAEEILKIVLSVFEDWNERKSEQKAWEDRKEFTSPAGMFWNLFVNDYKPLAKIIEDLEAEEFICLLAQLVLINEYSEAFDKTEKIHLAFILYQFRLSLAKLNARCLEPYARREEFRKLQAKIKRNEPVQKKDKIIREIFLKLKYEGLSSIQKRIAQELKKNNGITISVSTISRSLKKQNLHD